MQQFVWIAVIAGAIVLFWLPVITAAIRGTDPLKIVVLLTVLTPLCGVTWFGAWIAVFALPGRRPAAAHPAAMPSWEDPKCLYGGVPAGVPAAVSHR
jgi:hypothetical protein